MKLLKYSYFMIYIILVIIISLHSAGQIEKFNGPHMAPDP